MVLNSLISSCFWENNDKVQNNDKVNITIFFIPLYFSFYIAPNVSQIHAGREFPDELPTKYCFSIDYFPVKEATKPDLRVFCCYGLVFSLFFFNDFHSCLNTDITILS